MVDRCYMCMKVATSREHAPPRNLFPEAREANGIDYRKHLITVPSCDKHNSAKSHDDEFLMASLVGIVGNNNTGYLHKLTKVQRAISRTNGVLLERVFTRKEERHVFEIGPNKFYEIQWGKPDAPRLIRCFDHIARALYFNHFGKRFKGRLVVILNYLMYDSPTQQNWHAFLSHRAEIDLRGKPLIGANPDVFYFQVTDADQYGVFLFKLCFYGGIEILVSFIPKGVVLPYNLPVELMNSGLPVIFKLEGKHYPTNVSDEESTSISHGILDDLRKKMPEVPPDRMPQ